MNLQMIYTTLNDLKTNYKNGFRCIHSEISNDAYTLHLKNFATEQSKILSTANLYEISKIKDYLKRFEDITERAGHDC